MDKDEKEWHLITPEKVFGFMWYQANRAKTSSKNTGKFDKADYDKTQSYKDDDGIDVVGFSAINQYLSAIRKLVDHQFNENLITLRRGGSVSNS